MIWRVGCYKINPTTPSGQKFFILHMVSYHHLTTEKCYCTCNLPLAGAAADPHHGPRHPERRHHEHPHVILLQVQISRYLGISTQYLFFQGLHHQEAGPRRNGDCSLHPEHPGRQHLPTSKMFGIMSYRRRGQRLPSTSSLTTLMPTLTCPRSSATIIGRSRSQ